MSLILQEWFRMQIHQFYVEDHTHTSQSYQTHKHQYFHIVNTTHENVFRFVQNLSTNFSTVTKEACSLINTLHLNKLASNLIKYCTPG